MADNDNTYIGILLEEIRDQNKAVLEAVGDIQQKVAGLPKLEDNVAELKLDVKTIKAAVRGTNKDVAALDTRVTNLENAA